MKSTIIKVVKALNKNKISYFLTGGVVLYLKGIVREIKDIDIFIDLKDFNKLRKIYSKNTIIVPENPKTYLNLILDGQEIEFVGTSYSVDKYANIMLKKKDYEIITLNKQKVNISTIKNLIKMYKTIYKRLEKEKHLKRIKLLENYIKRK